MALRSERDRSPRGKGHAIPQPGLAPNFPLGPPTSRPWREGAITRVNELDAILRWLVQQPDVPAPETLVQAVDRHLGIAREAAQSDHHVWRSLTGATLERAASNIDAAEAHLLRIAGDDYLRGQMPSFLAHVGRHLAQSDPRRVAIEEIATSPAAPKGRAVLNGFSSSPAITDQQRNRIVAAVRAASSEAVREQLRACSFRNVLVVTALILMLLASGVALLGFLDPARVPLCFSPSQDGSITVVCPTATSKEEIPTAQAGTGTTPEQSLSDIDDVIRATADPFDVFTVEALGLVAAALASAVALRGLRGSSEPFGLPLALALLKLPSGALTAVLGLLLMRGGFVPGLSALDTSAQILAWAVLFGYAQQVFTRLVDQQAHTILDSIRSKRTKPED